MTTITLTVTLNSKLNNGGGGGPLPPSNTVAPVISGSSVIGSTLTSTTGTWTGTPVITYAYQWKRNGGNIGGATSSTYILVNADYNNAITCEVTATNIAGSASATSNSITGTAAAPSNIVPPVISGSTSIGSTLSCTTGTWTGTPTPTYSYTWYRGASPISGATSSTYTLVVADGGNNITCVVIATNVAGSLGSTSNSLTIPLLLDSYPNAAVAYSVRKLRTAYSGAALRVRRSSDNAESDIGFVSNQLDTASLLSFVGAGNGFVTTWYDQSGNGNNLTQTTAANQPRIVNAGVLETKNTKAGFRFDGSNDTLSRAALTALNSGNTYSIFSVSSNNLTSSPGDIISTNNSSLSRMQIFCNTSTATVSLVQNTALNSFTCVDSSVDTSLNQRLITFVANGFNIAAWKNNIATTTNTYTGTYTNGIFEIGVLTNLSRYLNGYTQEIIIYPSNQTSNRAIIETNINSYFNIYP